VIDRMVTPLTALPADRYTSRADYEHEIRDLLAPSWQFACHESDLPGPGTALRFDFCGRSAVLLRAPDHSLTAVINVCRHRGSRLIDGDASTGLAFCVDSKFRCPYHGWTYDARGALESVPRESQYPGLERASLGLRPLEVASRSGWIFVAFERPAHDLIETAGEWLESLAPYDCGRMRRLVEPLHTRVRANWKLVCEDRLERRGHVSDGPLAAPDPAALLLTPVGPDTFAVASDFVASAVSGWPSQLYLTHLPASATLPSGLQRHWSRAFLWPNALFEVSPDTVFVTQVLPQSPGECVVREIAYGLPGTSRAMRAVRYLHRRMRRKPGKSRTKLVERVQAGLETGDYVPGPVAGDEAGVRWYQARVGSAYS
jgi:phenylpropionate dioxygenase-like ring-hydroxylating dioxygenase large terminal subunit